jgi:hypothetical protein
MKEKKNQLSRQILNYLKKHPQAGDTLEGIAGWWLAQQRIEEVVDEVADALETLIKKGAIKAHTTRSGSSVYKINPKT